MKYKLLLLSLWISTFFIAQNPVDYMKKVNTGNQEIMEGNWKYLSAIARGKSPGEVQQLRGRLEGEIRSVLRNLNSLGSFSGDDSYRNASIAYQKFALDMITGQASKLVNMEKISQNSFDAMEAYILYQRELNKLNDKESKKINQAQADFAEKNSINLIQEESELAKKLEEGSKIMSYKQDMFLVFARCSMYELDMFSRFGSNEEYDFAQAGVTLLDLLDQSRAAIDTINDVNADKSLRTITEKALKFFEEEAEVFIPEAVAFQKAQNNFKNLEKKMSKTPKSEMTQEMVDEYNERVKEINEKVNTFTNLFNEYSQQREKNFNEWNATADAFVNKHMPEE